MRRIFEPAPSFTVYNTGAEYRQAQINEHKKPNTFSFVSPSDMVSPPVEDTINLSASSLCEYPVDL